MSASKQKFVILDPDMKDIVGKSRATRGEIIRAFNNYIKDEDLVSEDDGRVYFPDDVLKDLFHEVGITPKSEMNIIGKAGFAVFSGNKAVDAGLIEKV